MGRLSFFGYRCAIWVVGACIAAMIGAVSSIAEDDIKGDVAAGHKLAVKECSRCHSIGGRDPILQHYNAPRFDDVAAKPQTTVISLRAFLQSSHPTMPNFVLSETERDNVIAYILSLRRQSL